MLRGVCRLRRLADRKLQGRRDPSGGWKGGKELLSEVTVLLRLDVIGCLHGLGDVEGGAIFQIESIKCGAV